MAASQETSLVRECEGVKEGLLSNLRCIQTNCWSRAYRINSAVVLMPSLMRRRERYVLTVLMLKFKCSAISVKRRPWAIH